MAIRHLSFALGSVGSSTEDPKNMAISLFPFSGVSHGDAFSCGVVCCRRVGGRLLTVKHLCPLSCGWTWALVSLKWPCPFTLLQQMWGFSLNRAMAMLYPFFLKRSAAAPRDVPADFENHCGWFSHKANSSSSDQEWPNVLRVDHRQGWDAWCLS